MIRKKFDMSRNLAKNGLASFKTNTASARLVLQNNV